MFKTEDINNAIELCNKLTKNYDNSHDVTHHVRVFNHACKIAEDELIDMNQNDINRCVKLITFSALLHDVIDHKYCNEQQKNNKLQELEIFLKTYANDDSENILWIIDNISFSKEKKRGYLTVHDCKLVTKVLRIVSDSDKLEALGVDGIQRMLDYMGKSVGIDEAMVRIKLHTHEKLVLLKDNYIHTKLGRKLAEPLHNSMMEIINDDDKLFSMIFNNK